MNQNRMPVIEMLRRFAGRNPAYFNVPGHRAQRGVDPALIDLFGPQVFQSDLTETDGTDNLHAPEGPILEAQKLAAELYGTDVCFFLVNGTTCGNEAMMMSVLKPGDTVLIARNAHHSVLSGLILSGAVPVWMEPEYEAKYGIYGAVSPDTARRALALHPEARAMLLVSPTYYGRVSNVRAIAAACHRSGIPLLVDAAHGAHFRFHPELPQDAAEAGADLISVSFHKTAGSLTQSSLLLAQGGLVNAGRCARVLEIIESSSPSYLLMASLDAARHNMAANGRKLWNCALMMADRMRSGLAGIPGIVLYPSDDPARVVFSGADAGLSGYALQKALFGYDVTTEMADPMLVVAIVVPGNTADDIDRLVSAVKEIVRSSSGEGAVLPEREPLPRPEVLCPPREAFYAEKRRVPVSEAEGKISGELILPYPPGIPLICPGERISCDVLERLRSLQEAGAFFQKSRPEQGFERDSCASDGNLQQYMVTLA